MASDYHKPAFKCERSSGAQDALTVHSRLLWRRFSGGNGIIYAVPNDGRLLFYRDNNQGGTGDVDTPKVIGLGGWGDFKFLFSGGNGIIYAVDQAGQLLFYRDNNQDGTGDVDTPKVIGLGGWGDFQFLFSAGNGIIYAIEKVASPADSYDIAADFQVIAPSPCDAEQQPVNQDTVALNDIKAQIRALQQEFDQATASEKHVPHRKQLARTGLALIEDCRIRLVLINALLAT